MAQDPADGRGGGPDAAPTPKRNRTIIGLGVLLCVAGAIAAAREGTDVDALMGIGWTPEGIVAACAIKALGGVIQGRLWFQLVFAAVLVGAASRTTDTSAAWWSSVAERDRLRSWQERFPQVRTEQVVVNRFDDPGLLRLVAAAPDGGEERAGALVHGPLEELGPEAGQRGGVGAEGAAEGGGGEHGGKIVGSGEWGVTSDG